jgi:P pilus assembly chaperone PapD
VPMKSFMIRAAAGLLLAAAAMPASAEIVLSQLIVELGSGKGQRGDIEVRNLDKERAYVLIEPQEVVSPGLPGEQRVRERDPEKLGLLVSPARMVLEPGQTRLLRVALAGPTPARERVYRITVKPTTGKVSADVSGLKILIGYEILVLVRAGEKKPQLLATRNGRTLTIRNAGTGSVELADGKQCAAKDSCQTLAGKRLYAGAEWKWTLPGDGPADFMVMSLAGNSRQSF